MALRCQGVKVWRKRRFVVACVWGIGRRVGVVSVGHAVVDAECRVQSAECSGREEY